MAEAGAYFMLADDYFFRFRTEPGCLTQCLVYQKTGVTLQPGTADYSQYFHSTSPTMPVDMPVSR